MKIVSKYFVLVSLLILGSCNNKTRFDESLIKNLEKYKEAKAILLKHKESIKINSHYQEYDTLRQIELVGILNANQFYYRNTFLKANPGNADLKKLLSLWESH